MDVIHFGSMTNKLRWRSCFDLKGQSVRLGDGAGLQDILFIYNLWQTIYQIHGPFTKIVHVMVKRTSFARAGHDGKVAVNSSFRWRSYEKYCLNALVTSFNRWRRDA